MYVQILEEKLTQIKIQIQQQRQQQKPQLTNQISR
jgi:hypothetical protein